MKKVLTILQAILLPLLLIAGLVFLVFWTAGPLREIPHLHLNPGRLRLSSAILLGGALLSLAFALLAAVYTLFNLRAPLYRLLLPLLAFAALCAVCRFCFLGGTKPMCYSYTESVEDFRAESDPENFRVRDQLLISQEKAKGVTAYQHYSDGESEAELVTVTFRMSEYGRETARFRAMDLTAFQVEDWLCYDLEENGVRYQVRLNKLTHQAVYCRFVNGENLPALAPQPLEEPEPEPETPPKSETTDATGSL